MTNAKKAAPAKKAASAKTTKTAATTTKKAATKKTLVVKAEKPTARKNKKAHKPWSVNGRTGYHEELKGFKDGDKVHIIVDGKKVTATYRYFKISPERYPEGRVHVEYNEKVIKRVKEAVTKVPAKAKA